MVVTKRTVEVVEDNNSWLVVFTEFGLTLISMFRDTKYYTAGDHA